jgi:hypothetical protein
MLGQLGRVVSGEVVPNQQQAQRGNSAGSVMRTRSHSCWYESPDLEVLRAFRQQRYSHFGCRRDDLFELVDTSLAAPTIEMRAHRSLVPICQPDGGASMMRLTPEA